MMHFDFLIQMSIHGKWNKLLALQVKTKGCQQGAFMLTTDVKTIALTRPWKTVALRDFQSFHQHQSQFEVRLLFLS